MKDKRPYPCRIGWHAWSIWSSKWSLYEERFKPLEVRFCMSCDKLETRLPKNASKTE